MHSCGLTVTLDKGWSVFFEWFFRMKLKWFAWMPLNRVFQHSCRYAPCCVYDIWFVRIVLEKKCCPFKLLLSYLIMHNAWYSNRNLKHTYMSSERLLRIDHFFHKNCPHLSLSAMSLLYDVRINTWNRMVKRRKCW